MQSEDTSSIGLAAYAMDHPPRLRMSSDGQMPDNPSAGFYWTMPKRRLGVFGNHLLPQGIALIQRICKHHLCSHQLVIGMLAVHGGSIIGCTKGSLQRAHQGVLPTRVCNSSTTSYSYMRAATTCYCRSAMQSGRRGKPAKYL